MNIPSQDDWGLIDQNDLDANWAFKTFFGKSFGEAEAMFQDNALCYQEDLQSMPAAAFNYYAPALAKYITSDFSSGDSDGASSFLHMVSWIFQTRRDIIASKTEELLVSASQQVANRQNFYDADVTIYGQFSDVYAEIESLAERRT